MKTLFMTTFLNFTIFISSFTSYTVFAMEANKDQILKRSFSEIESKDDDHKTKKTRLDTAKFDSPSLNDEPLSDSRKYVSDRESNIVLLAAERAEGREEGKLEGQKNIALKMLEDNAAIELISKYTGLTLEEINNLKYQ